MCRRFGWSAEPYEYRPTASVTFQVTVPRNFAPVAFETPGPERRNPSLADRSSTTIANAPAAVSYTHLTLPTNREV